MIHTVINKYKNEEGSGLVLSLMVLLVLSVLGSALGIITVGSHKLADINRDSTTAYYIAEAGSNMAFEEVKRDILSIYNNSEITSALAYFTKINQTLKIDNNESIYRQYDKNEFESQLGNEPTAKIKIEPMSGNEDVYEYTLTSIGEVGGGTRTVEKVFKVEWVKKNPPNESDVNINLPVPPTGSAIIFSEKIHTRWKSVIEGDLLYTGAGTPDIQLHNDSTHTGGKNKNDKLNITEYKVDLTSYSENMSKIIADWNKYDERINKIIEKKPSKLQSVSGTHSGVLKVNNDSYITKLSVEYGKTLEIIVPDHDINVVVDTLDINQNSKIKIIGNGRVNFYVNNSLKIGSYVDLKSGINNQLNIIYTGSTKVNIGEVFKLNGSLIFEKNGIDFNNTAHITGDVLSLSGAISFNEKAEIKGNIFSGNGGIKFGNNSKVTGDIITRNGKVDIYQYSIISGNVVSGKGDIIFGNNTSVTGNILNQNGKIDIYQNSTVNGNIISDNGNIVFGNKVTIAGNIVARNGTIVTSPQGGIVNGNILNDIGSISTGQDSTTNGIILSNNGKVTIGYGSKVYGVVISGNNEAIVSQKSLVSGVLIAKIVNLIDEARVEYDSNFKDYYKIGISDSDEEGYKEPDLSELLSSQPAIEQ